MKLSENSDRSPLNMVSASVGLQLREVHRILVIGIDFASDRAAACQCNDHSVIFNVTGHILHVVVPFLARFTTELPSLTNSDDMSS